MVGAIGILGVLGGVVCIVITVFISFASGLNIFSLSVGISAVISGFLLILLQSIADRLEAMVNLLTEIRDKLNRQ